MKDSHAQLLQVWVNSIHLWPSWGTAMAKENHCAPGPFWRGIQLQNPPRVDTHPRQHCIAAQLFLCPVLLLPFPISTPSWTSCTLISILESSSWGTQAVTILLNSVMQIILLRSSWPLENSPVIPGSREPSTNLYLVTQTFMPGMFFPRQSASILHLTQISAQV